MRGRRIAFDYGDVRIGVAVCDADAILSSPLAPLRSSDPNLFLKIEELISEYQPVRFFVGLPLNMSGTSGDSADKAKVFGSELSERFTIPVTFIDERLSTVTAQRKLKDAGVSTRESKELIDSMAAVAILEQGLLSDR
jgi:putative holliday junction resolvase